MDRSVSDKLKLVNDYVDSVAPPIKVTPLAQKLGIRVFGAPWPDEISGKIQRDAERGGDSGFAIFVNKSHSKTRQRFTVAHEIAHYILHERQIGDGIFDDAMYRSGLPHREEVQANELAADILMPKRHVIEMVERHGSDVPSLANLFDVSRQAMSIRLSVLGVPVWDEAV